MNGHHKAALATISACSALTMLWGWLFSLAEQLPATTGLYWSVITAATVGYGDVIPHNPLGRLIAVAAAITAIPLYSASVGLFIGGVAARVIHNVVHDAKTEIKDHVEERLRHHLQNRM
jgi:voltage-gated potassium channel Kch